jgi:hypothetical protein
MLPLDEQAQAALQAMPTMLDQCIGAITLRGDSTTCRNLSVYLMTLRPLQTGNWVIV